MDGDRKYALVIGNSQYEDAKLSRLESPKLDVESLVEILKSSELGEFDEVRGLTDLTDSETRREVWRFFRDKKPHDLLLFYYSGHGVMAPDRELYFACRNTEMELLDATAFRSAELRRAMDGSRSRRMIVILDCCNSGAFGRGAKAALGSSVGTSRLVADAPPFEWGEGWITLTASDENQVAWEGENLLGQVDRSIFTEVLIDGLRTGAADLNADGWVGANELYEYLLSNVRRRQPQQRPKRFVEGEGEFAISRRAPGTETPVPLDPQIEDDLASDRKELRLAAVRALSDWLHSRHIGRILAAEQMLQKIAKQDDSDAVKTAARTTLEQRPSESQPTVDRLIVIPDRGRPPRAHPVTHESPEEIKLPKSTPEGTKPSKPAADESPQPNSTSQSDSATQETVREQWWAWALREFGGDARRAQIASGAAMDAMAAGATAVDAAAAAYRAVDQQALHQAVNTGDPTVARPAVGRPAADRPAVQGLATFWIRVGAYVIDSIIVGVVNLVISFLVTLAAGGQLTGPAAVFVFVIEFGIWVAYFSYLWSSRGQSIGMKLTNIEVIREDGSRLTLGQAIGRALALQLSFLILCIGVIMVAFTERKQGLHDLLCKTLVVYK